MENIEKIKEDINNAMINGINSVIHDDEKVVKLHFVRPHQVIQHLKTLGINTDKYDQDTNGWSWDWWMNFDYEDKLYQLSTDGYYSNNVVLTFLNELKD